MSTDTGEVTITRLGAQGDGVGETTQGPVYIPFGLPGERWILADDQEHDARWQRLNASPDRRAPICRHFATCGGCIAQHMDDGLYRTWKRETVVQAFAHRGIPADVAPLESVPLHSRRRAVFGIARRAGAKEPDLGSNTPIPIQIGFREAGQHRLVDLTECPVLDTRITAALGGLRQLALPAMDRDTGGRLVVTATDTGLDVALSTGAIKLTPHLRARLAAAAEALGLARLIVEGEEIVVRTRPRLLIGGVATEPPNGVFLQAVPAAEARMVELVLAGVGKSKRIVDLFCGIGTFTFPLSRKAQVLAVDDDKAALATLTAAQRGAQGLKPITVKRRDLFREPLSAMELKDFDAVVIDPPRAGAQSQMEAIANSTVRTVVAVSCNPATLARDARILIDARFMLGTVTPIDQFVFSPHVETVVVLRR